MIYYPATSILDDAKLNCQGILMLQESKTEQAISCFSKGLRSVLSTLRHEAQHDNDGDDDDERMIGQPNDDIPIHADLLISIELPQRQKVPSTDSDNDSECRFAIYNRPLHMSFDDDSTDASSRVPEAYCHLLCAVFLYNIGLAHHAVAMENGGSSSMLRKALEFYSMAHQTIPHGDESMSEELSSLALLALANNLGHVHFFLCHHKEAKMCADEILDRLSFLWNSARLSGSSSSKRIAQDDDVERDYRVFMLNAAFFLATDTMPAPAA